MSEKYPDFGSRVREILRAKGITIEKFSEAVGVTENFMAKNPVRLCSELSQLYKNRRRFRS